MIESMDNRDEILYYLKEHPKSRAFQITRSVSAPRREVFRLLKLLRKRGIVKKEGFHPKIFYSWIPGEEEPVEEKTKPVPAAVKPVPAKNRSSTADSNLSDWQKMYDLRRELDLAKGRIQELAALLEHQEGVSARLDEIAATCAKEKNLYLHELLDRGIKVPYLKTK
jgi:hypothetical protein